MTLTDAIHASENKTNKASRTMKQTDEANNEHALATTPGPLAEPIRCELTSEASLMVASALEAAGRITLVEDKDTLVTATSSRTQLRNTRLALDANRKALKEPFRKALDAIEEVFAKPILDIKIHEHRLEGMVNRYGRKAEEERRAALAQLEEEKVQKDRDAQAAIQRLEAAQRQGGEAAAEALLDVALTQEELEAVSEAVEQNPDSVGVKVKATLDYEVEGNNEREKSASTLKFASRFPQLCKIELKRSLVLAALNDGGAALFTEEKDGLPVVPGLRVFEKLTSRAPKGVK